MNISAQAWGEARAARRNSKSRAGEPVKTLLFSTLYPSAARPGHGIFVETRLRQLLASQEVMARAVAPVPWFPSRHGRYGEWATWAATPRHETRNGIEVWHPRYALPPSVGMNIAPLTIALGARASIVRLIRDGGDFDLIDAHYYYPDGAAAALLSHWFKKPFVVTARGSDINLLAEYAIPRFWIRWTEKQASASITVSQALKDRLVALGGDPERIRVLRNGVDLAMFRPADRRESRRRLGLPDGFSVLSVGNLLAAKGHDIAVETLKALPQNTHLTIVGDGRDRARLAKLAEDLGMAARVNLVGSRPQNELRDWYSAADVLVLCSSREGWPNVLLEALACGTPVVAANVGGVREIVRSPIAGRLVEKRTADAFAAAIRSVLSSRVDREAIRRYALDFDWDGTTRGQIDVFRAVVRGERIVTRS